MIPFRLIVIIFLLLFFSCGKENKCDCIKGTGDISTQTRDIKDIRKIIIYDKINVIIIPDSNEQVQVEAGENLIDLIKTDYDNGQLTIKNHNRCNWTRSYKKPINVYISSSHIRNISFYGSGSISSQGTLCTPDSFCIDDEGSGHLALNIKTDIARFRIHSGSSDYNISGDCNFYELYSGSNAIFNGIGLSAKEILVNNNGTGNFIIAPEKTLYVMLSGSGNIYYTGNPGIIIYSQTGKGKLLPQQ